MRRILGRLMAVAGTALLMCGSLASVVSAGPRIRDADNAIGGSATIEGSYGGGGGGVSGCEYVPASSTLAEAPMGERLEANGVVYRYYSEICHGDFTRAVWIRDYSPADVRARGLRPSRAPAACANPIDDLARP